MLSVIDFVISITHNKCTDALIGFADVFLLGVETGILYPHKSLMGQTRDFHLVVEAKDSSDHMQLYDRSTINVHVLNINEQRPEFIMPALPNATVEVLEVMINNILENICRYLVSKIFSFVECS